MATTDKPNILFLFTDQQRFDTIGAVNNPVIRTPNLDRLVESGTWFDSAYTPSPECVPARCSLTYGQYPGSTNCCGNGESFPLKEKESYMAVLTRSGYRTHGVGKYHFEYHDRQRTYEGNGFQTRDRQEEIVSEPEKDDYLQTLKGAGLGYIADPHGLRGEMYYMPQPAQMSAEAHPTQWVGDRTLSFLKAQQGNDKPWMCFSSFIHPHPPFCPPVPWTKLYRDIDVPPPHMPPDYESLLIYINHFQNRYKRYDRGIDLHRARMLRAYYYACISFIDFQVGRILDYLDESGQRENTLIAFSADHGELLGDYGSVGKRSYHDAAMRVPMILSQPGVVPAGKTVNTPVNLIDITETFLEVSGDKPSTHKTQGRSLIELANAPDEDRMVFSQLYRGQNAIYTAISNDWKLAHSAPDHRDLFFDRKRDPRETQDLACAGGGPANRYREPMEQMKAALIAHLRQTGSLDGLDGDELRTFPRKRVGQNPNSGLIWQDHPWAAREIPGYTD